LCIPSKYQSTTRTERLRGEEELRIFRTLAEHAPDAIGIADPSGSSTYANPALRSMFGYGDAVIGMSNSALFSKADRQERLPTVLETVARQGSWTGMLTGQRHDGSTFPTQIAPFTLCASDGQILAIPCILRDLSAMQRAAIERTTLQEQVIVAQQAALRELSTPLIPSAAGVVAMPLIGRLDNDRAQQVIDVVLAGVAEQRTTTVILDITGVPIVDTHVANTLLRAAQAVQLLGARVMLTGIRPEVAQTLVGLGVDLNGIRTLATLQSAISNALGRSSAPVASYR
jgi:rsbT co-antagonist protein RsbR